MRYHTHIPPHLPGSRHNQAHPLPQKPERARQQNGQRMGGPKTDDVDIYSILEDMCDPNDVAGVKILGRFRQVFASC